jgi:SET domain-containing protein
MMQRIPSLYVGLIASKGRGVFTSEPLSVDDLIEICPVIICSEDDLPLIHQTRLHDYYFLWGEAEDKCAIALGYGSLYNHDYKPNARYEVDFEAETISFYCLKPINAGEEITVNYNGDWEDENPVWFDKK